MNEQRLEEALLIRPPSLNSIKPSCNKYKTQFPLSNEVIYGRPLYVFREWYPQCCLSSSMNSFYPLLDTDEKQKKATLAVPEDITSPVIDQSGPVNVTFENIDPNEHVRSIHSLPDHILTEILLHLHPVHLVHSISLVCQRWRHIVENRIFWRSIRVVISNPPFFKEHVARRLQKICKWTEKLCLYVNINPGFGEVSDVDLVSLFPSMMTSLTVLDIGFLKVFSPLVLSFFILHCPNLERLNMEGFVQVNDGIFHLLFDNKSFPKLRQLILAYCEALEPTDFAELCASTHQLEVLSIDGIPSLRTSSIRLFCHSLSASTIVRLYLDGEALDDNAFLAISNCSNLELLSVSFCESASDAALTHLKFLRNLEHLHLRKGKEFSAGGLRNFFELSKFDAAQTFPSRLKFLNIGECPCLNDSVVDVITKNCPLMRSLCIFWCWSVTDDGLAMIAQRLPDLIFLDVSGLDCIDGNVLIDVPDLWLPKLRFLGACHCPRVEDSTLQFLCLRKRDLIVSDYSSSFIIVNIDENGQFKFDCRNDHVMYQAVLRELMDIEGFCCLPDIR
ncbi:hypothetical protein AB6A40_001909 [Gnathostoma spinigerum]|uniref:F-box domain-containing protein n=1 Tax=Gnathostoma spinigerum TaxID=75299 RepID=A0ABD6E5B0_9BILA